MKKKYFFYFNAFCKLYAMIHSPNRIFRPVNWNKYRFEHIIPSLKLVILLVMSAIIIAFLNSPDITKHINMRRTPAATRNRILIMVGIKVL